ncbi:MAG: helix-turn-helix domain-containing protein [Bacteroidales bacterium]|nr:helix-turn-helix domain-containing protein [Bacteroidales bacterium]
MAKIENEKQYKAALQRIEELIPYIDENTPEYDNKLIEFLLLTDLVSEYEDIHYPIDRPSLAEVIKLRMLDMGLSQCALAKLLGMNQSKVSEILSGKCEPTLKQARTIAVKLEISPDIVLGV